MKLVIQRVTEASVNINGEETRSIGRGFVVLIGITEGDTRQDVEYLASKCVSLRVFTDETDKMNLALQDIGGELLLISQFTLYGDCRKGNRPNFMKAAKPDVAKPLYEHFIEECKKSGIPVQTGEFGADMQVRLCNDGPVTILMDTAEMR